jgi:hypothetical protein
MVGTRNEASIARALQQFMPAVLADVIKTPQLAFGVARGEDTLPLDVRSNIAAWFTQFAFVAEILPGLVKNVHALNFQVTRIPVTGFVDRKGSRGDRVVAARDKIQFFSRQLYGTKPACPRNCT